MMRVVAFDYRHTTTRDIDFKWTTRFQRHEAALGDFAKIAKDKLPELGYWSA